MSRNKHEVFRVKRGISASRIREAGLLRLRSQRSLLTIITLFLATTAFAGVARYSVNYADTTYNQIAGTTVPFVDFDDDCIPVPIGFTFIYDGVAFDTLVVTTDGYGFPWFSPAGLGSTGANNLTDASYKKPVLAPLWDDLKCDYAGKVTYLTEGTSGSRVFTVQWRNVRRSTTLSDTALNFQLKLFETSNNIMFVFGDVRSLYTLSYSLGINDPIGGPNHFLMQDSVNFNRFRSTGTNAILTVLPISYKRYLFTRPTPISSNITVTPGTGDYPFVKAAMDTLCNYGVSSSINVLVSGTTTEPAAANTWDFIPGTHTSFGNNTVTLKLADGISSATITGNVAGDAVQLRGMRNFVIDGDDPTIGGIQRALTVNNTNVGAAGRTLVLNNGCNGVKVKNCILTANAASGAATTFGVVAITTPNISTGTSRLGVYGTNTYNIIENNDISGALNRPTNCVILFGLVMMTDGFLNIGNIIRGNDIRNFTGTGIFINYADSGVVITQNKVYMEQASLAATVTGIRTSKTSFPYYAVKSPTVTRNEIYNLLTTATNPLVRGIQLDGGHLTNPITPKPSPALIANNMIYLNPPENFGTGCGIGISVGAESANIYFNSIRIGGSQTEGVGNTFCLRSDSVNARMDVRNNIWYNTRSNEGTATGKHYACSTGVVPVYTVYTANYNDLFVSGTGGVLGSVAGTDYTTLAAWRTATGQDANSISQDPKYTGATNLHIDTLQSSYLESQGRPISGIFIDFDGDTRAGSSKYPYSNVQPDIGADEFRGTAVDVVAPTISYTRLANTALTRNRTLKAYIKDWVSGVASDIGRMPRLYFKKGAAGTYALDSVYTPVGDSWTFTFNHNNVGGVTVGDTIFYYIQATDSSNNTGTNPAGAPTNLFSYRIVYSLYGTKTVGTAKADYTTLTSALTTHPNSWKNNIITGDVIFLLTDETYPGETYPLVCTIPQLYEDYEDSVWTLTVKPAPGVTPTITGSNATAIFDLYGINRLTIDSVTVSNTSTAGPAVRFFAGASYNTVKNCTLKSVNTSSSGVVFFSTGIGTGNNYNTIENCNITQGATSVDNGIYFEGWPSPLDNRNNTVKKCNIYDFNSRGIEVADYTNYTTVTECDIYTLNYPSTGNISGIRVAATGSARPVGTMITRNKIHDLRTTDTGLPDLRGIWLGGIAITGVTTIANNFISIDANYTHPKATVYGIDCPGVTANPLLDVYYNSIYIGGNVGTETRWSYCFYSSVTAGPIVNLKNNILFNNRSRSSGTTKYHYAIYCPVGAYITSNYNDLYVSGDYGQCLGYWGTDCATLAAWQTASGQDANSISLNPDFRSTTDLHIDSLSYNVNRKATPITGITKDFDNEDRHPTYPDIGADEYTPTPTPPGSITLLAPLSNAIGQPLSGRLRWDNVSLATYYDVYLDTLATPVNKVSALQPDTGYNYSGLSRLTKYYWKIVAWNDTNPAKAGSSSSVVDSFTTGNPAPTLIGIDPTSGNRLQTLDVVFTGTNFIDGVSSVSFGPDITVDTTTVNSPTSITANITITAAAATGARDVEVRNVGPGGGTATLTGGFTVNNPAPTLSSIDPTSKNVGDPEFTLTVNGTNFVSTSVVKFAGSDRITSYVSSEQLTATIPASDLLVAGTFDITVFNPTPGGGESNAQTFTVNNPAPTLSSIDPTSKNVGDPEFTLTVNGTNFVSTSVVRFAGSDRITSYVSSEQLTATIPASDLLVAGTFDITVFNPAPGGGVSNAQTFTVTVVGLPGWAQKESLPPLVKDGGALVGVSGSKDGGALYALRGSKSKEFYLYNGAWILQESIPYGYKYPVTEPPKINKKTPGKGAALCYDGDNIIYATKGNSTWEFWAYDVTLNTWTAKAFIPSAKKLKGGTSMAYYEGKVYLLAGAQKKDNLNNFFAYDPTQDTVGGSPWTTLTGAPVTPPATGKAKPFKDGSCISLIGNTIYALKGGDKYNFFYAYDIATDIWTEMESIPLIHPVLLKKNKVGDGGAMTSSGSVLYAIKGKGKKDFWMYTPNAIPPDTGVWTPLDTIPTLHKKSVPKTGAALAFANGKVFLLKGNKGPEFWCYVPSKEKLNIKNQISNISQNVIASESEAISSILSLLDVTPNPFTKLTTIRYTVPVSGKITIKLYNATGRLIETLVNNNLNAGSYTLKIENWKLKISKGVYFLKYESKTNKVVLKLIVQ